MSYTTPFISRAQFVITQLSYKKSKKVYYHVFRIPFTGLNLIFRGFKPTNFIYISDHVESYVRNMELGDTKNHDLIFIEEKWSHFPNF